MHTKKIFHIITGGESGGAQTHLFDMCTHMGEGYTPLVAIGSPGSLGDRLRAADIPVYEVRALVRKISPGQDIRAYYELKHLIKQLQPDLICTHSSKAGFLGRLAAKQAGLPAIFTVHGWAFTEGVAPAKQFIYRYLEGLAARWCQKIICVSEYDYYLADRYRVAASQKMVVIHNGLPPGPEQVTAGPRQDAVTRIIMVARFTSQKDYPLLLQAVSELEIDGPFTVDLVGDGPLRRLTMDLAARLNILDKVQFLGDRADVTELLRRADIFVLTSHWEGFPITILEAMRAGLPVIATDVGGCREAVLDGSTGYLIKPGDREKLKRCLETLISNPAIRSTLGKAGYAHFQNNFTIDKMAVQTMAVYDEILSEGN